MMERIARRSGVPLVHCNLVGGNDDLVFDGSSVAFDARGRLVGAARRFEEDFWTIDVPGGRGPVPSVESAIPGLRKALVLALSDYAAKCGFKSAVLGLSGGIDSAVTAALAVEALGPERVLGVAMPGPYSSEGSLHDARALAERLGIPCAVIPIGQPLDAYRATLGPLVGMDKPSPTEENLQARIRGAILMALSNRFGHLVLSTGNKSEIAVGYCTLYGDMAGGYALISDVPKTMVYELARGVEPRPRADPARLDREAALGGAAAGPEGHRLAAALRTSSTRSSRRLVDLALPIAKAARRAGVPVALAQEIADRIDRNEYKRRQMPPGPKVTARSFGEGRRYPIAQKFRG